MVDVNINVSAAYREGTQPAITGSVITPTADGSEVSLPYILPSTPTTHYDKVLNKDTTYDSGAGTWGTFTGYFVGHNHWPSGITRRDLYTMSDLTLLSSATKVVLRFWYWGGRTSYPYGHIRSSCKTHDVVYDSNLSVLLSAGLAWYYCDWAVNPNTGLAWTLAEINALEAGMMIGGTASFGTAICDYFFIEVICTNIYPTNAITRVTSLVHRYNRATSEYNLEVNLGEVDATYAVPRVDLVTQSSNPQKQGEEVPRTLAE